MSHRIVGELSNDPVVRAFGWAILARHFVVVAFLLDTRILSDIAATPEPWCWPYFESCWRLRVAAEDAAQWVTGVHVLLLLLIGAAGLALGERKYRTFWCTLVLLNLLQFAVMSMDYRLRLNELYMLFWSNFVYLCWPAKRWAIPLTLVSFYFWAGRLKVNEEWLSGAVLYDDLLLIPKQFAPAACVYVVLLELVVSWGLLAARPMVVVACLAQFALFHIESLSQIHWFYPALMATMLSWFVLELKLGPDTRPQMLSSLFRARAPAPAYALVALFASCQLYPLLQPGDFALSGHGRLIALHMFQARQICEVTGTIHRANGSTEIRDLKLSRLAPRSVCDPIIYYNRAQSLCRTAVVQQSAQLDLSMRVRRSTDPQFTTIVNQRDFCRQVRDYAVWSKNDWLN